MSTPIDSLELQVTSNVGDAVRGLNKLADTLAKLQKATASFNVTGVAPRMQELADAMRPLSAVNNKGLVSTVNALKKFPEVMKSLNAIDMGAIATKMQELADAMRPLADEMQKVANGFSAFPDKLQKYMNATNGATTTNNRHALSFANIYAKFKVLSTALKAGINTIGKFVTASSEYVENVNLFTVSMGKYAEEAKAYAEEVGNIMGIDPGEWMRNRGVFMTLAKGFGVAGDRANTMSKNLTQLGYDISSFFNISTEDAMQKLQSGIAGELEPLRRIGYDLSQARLELEAYNLGISKKVSEMTQAEKAELRYYAIMTQVTDAQGDMARTLDAPANQLRILKAQVTQATRAIGNLFIPILNKVLPVANAVLQVIRSLADTIARLFGIEITTVDFESAGEGANTISDGLGTATENAKKLKNLTAGFDELNVLSTSDSGASDESPLGGGFGFELPEYDFISDATQTKVNEIVEKMKEWLGITEDIDSWADLFKTKLGGIAIAVGVVAIGLTAWRIIEGVAGVLDTLSKFGGKNEGNSAGGGEIGGGVSQASAKLKTLAKNLGLGIAIIAEVVVAAGIFIGGIWLIGALLEQVGIAWQPIINNGAAIATAMGIGTTLLAGIGVATALLGKLGGKMCGQIGIGIAVLAELGIATGLFLAEIWGMGFLLEKIGIAWQPVLDNGNAIANSIGWGTALLVGIGVVTGLLGAATVASAGALPIAIGLGTAMLIALAFAFTEFCDSLIKVADKLSEDLHPALENASLILPELTTNMSTFTDFMSGFAGEVVRYSASNSIAGIAATIDTIIGFFTKDPVKKMSNEVDSQIGEFNYLIKGLETIIPRIERATELVNQYNDVMGTFDETTGANKGLLGNLGIVKEAINKIISGIESMTNGVIKGINGMIRALNNLSFDVPDWVPGIGGETFGLRLKTISEIKIPRFANGGFPEQGQMFIAREAGAEMVGSIGRKTAVANNDQIVAGIANGVASANSESNALLREQNELLRAMLAKESGVYLDGKKVTQMVERRQRERGRVLVTGGAY